MPGYQDFNIFIVSLDLKMLWPFVTSMVHCSDNVDDVLLLLSIIIYKTMLNI